LREWYRDGLKPGVYCGWKQLRDYYRPRKGEFSVITGTPGSGKSTWLDALMVNLMTNHGWKFAVFSAENMPIERHIISLACKLSGFPFHPGSHMRISPQDLELCIDTINNNFWFLDPDENERTIDHLLELAIYGVKEKGIDGFVIDPWNELDHTRPAWMSETEYISKALSKIRFFSRRNKVHVWLVAHPAKMYRNKDGSWPTPGLYDISGSAHFRNKSDMGIVVHRDLEDDNGVTQINIAKVRFHENGRLGMVPLHFEKMTGRYF
jgi:twinkle protein